jgi:polar amino acid transport system substrate-binding protein
LLTPLALHAQALKICVDEDWFPYTFVKDGKNAGIHTDIVREAFRSLGYKHEIAAKPWKRCLIELEAGEVEAIYPASYKEKRAIFSYYPSDVISAKQSRWRLSQVEHVLVTRKGDDYDGDISKLPQPLGIGFGSAYGGSLEKKGVKVSYNVSKQSIIDMLFLKRINSAALASFQAQDLNTKSEYVNQLKIHKIPLRSKSYFLIFSKKGKLTEAERLKTWDAFEKIRNNKKLKRMIMSKYIDLDFE